MNVFRAVPYLFLLFLYGCSTIEKPNTFIVNENKFTISEVAQSYPAYLVVGDFDSQDLYDVDVENNLAVSVDCSGFGTYLQNTIIDGLLISKLFQKTSVQPPKNNMPYLKLTGKVDNIVIKSNSATNTQATGEITAELMLMPEGKLIETYHIEQTGIASKRYLLSRKKRRPPGFLFGPRKSRSAFSESLNPLSIKTSEALITKMIGSPKLAKLVNSYQELMLAVSSSKRNLEYYQSKNSYQEKNNKQLDIDMGDFYALVIGNNSYPNLPSLKTARHDAITVAETLNRHYGFDVNLMLDASRSEILTTLEDYRNNLSEKDNFLIYYAGHGWLDKDADMGYWLPVDASQDNQVNWISNSMITASVRAIKAKHIMVVSDSCYSGKMVRGLKNKKTMPGYLNTIAQKKARVVLSSGSLEPVLDSGGKNNHSIFAAAFISALNANTGVIDGASLSSQVRQNVGWNGDQTPEYSNIHKAGHDGGDFIFIRQ